MSDRAKESTYFLRLTASEYSWLTKTVLWERDHYEMTLRQTPPIPGEYRPKYEELLKTAQSVLFALANVRPYPANQPDVNITHEEVEFLVGVLGIYMQFPRPELAHSILKESIPTLVWKLRLLAEKEG